MENAMQKSVKVFSVAAAAAFLSGAMLPASSRAQALSLAAPSLAIAQANAAQKVPYRCQRGSSGGSCTYVARPHRNLRGGRPYASRAYPDRQPRSYAAERYFPFYYANPQGSD
jgi:hypothetical protein